mmetsp:Transcript_60716/g.144456  ORF Transcript_60716/g.144456 Transcript_60716/m.144456 type:complete len:578 (-) Transcript_60716:132-1865(-)
MLVHQRDPRPPVPLHHAQSRLQHANQKLHDRCLARAVLPQKADTRGAVDAHLHVRKEVFAARVREPDLAETRDGQLERPPPAEVKRPVLIVLEERKFVRLLLGLGIALLDLLDPLHLRRDRPLESVGLALAARVLKELRAARVAQLRRLGVRFLHLLALRLERVVVAAVQRQPPRDPRDVQHVRAHRVSEGAVVADDDHDARLPDRGLRERPLQPEDAVDGKMVRRLVEHQHVRGREEGGGEGHAHAPPARERFHGAGEELFGEAERDQHRARPPLGAIGVNGGEALDGLSHLPGGARLILLPLFLRGRRHRLEARVVLQEQFAFHVCPQHHVDRQNFLVDICEGELLRDVVHRHVRREALDTPGRDPPQQRRLTLAVPPDQTVPVPCDEAEANVLEEVLPSAGVRQLERAALDHAGRAARLPVDARARRFPPPRSQLCLHLEVLARLLLRSLDACHLRLGVHPRLGRGGLGVHVRAGVFVVGAIRAGAARRRAPMSLEAWVGVHAAKTITLIEHQLRLLLVAAHQHRALEELDLGLALPRAPREVDLLPEDLRQRLARLVVRHEVRAREEGPDSLD